MSRQAASQHWYWHWLAPLTVSSDSLHKLAAVRGERIARWESWKRTLPSSFPSISPDVKSSHSTPIQVPCRPSTGPTKRIVPITFGLEVRHARCPTFNRGLLGMCELGSPLGVVDHCLNSLVPPRVGDHIFIYKNSTKRLSHFGMFAAAILCYLCRGAMRGGAIWVSGGGAR